jgi:hypothetical protein
MRTKSNKAKAKPKAKAKKAAGMDRIVDLENRVAKLEQAMPGTPLATPQSLPEGGLPPAGGAIANP